MYREIRWLSDSSTGYIKLNIGDFISSENACCTRLQTFTIISFIMSIFAPKEKL